MRASRRGLPSWHKGQLQYCDISGFWYGAREGKLFKQRGILVDKKNYDRVTNEQMARSAGSR